MFAAGRPHIYPDAQCMVYFIWDTSLATYKVYVGVDPVASRHLKKDPLVNQQTFEFSRNLRE